MKHSTYIGCFIAFLLVFSCKEEEVDQGPYNTVIEGYMTERGTGNPIAGIQIDLFGPASAEGSREVITDEQGFYRFELGMQDDSRRFYVDFFGSNWYYNWPGEHRATNQGYNRIDGKLFASGWVDLHIKNVDPWDFDDNCYFLHGSIHSYNSKVDKSIFLEFPANEPYIFRYQITRFGETTFMQDTLYPIGKDTVSHEILY